MTITVEEISRRHDRKAFDCGVLELNNFIQLQARQKAVKHISKTYVACQKDAPNVIAGYYTLTGYSVISPPEHRDYKNYPHPLNAVKMARLAVDQNYQGQRLGEHLLIDAIHRTVLVEEQISSIGLFVDPKSPDVVPFYQQYGFLSVDTSDPSQLEMWLPIQTCFEVVRES